MLAPVDARGQAVPGSEQQFECDVVAMSGGTAPATSLLLQGGARARYDGPSGRFVVDELPAGVLAAGAVAGHESADAAELSGAVAGADAALALGFGDDAARAALSGERGRLDALGGPAPVATPPAVAGDGKGGGKSFVDLDEDVTAKDIVYAAREGYDSIELSKRYTTTTMGPSQGRFSQLASIRVLAQETGLSLGDVGLTTARPPWSPVPMGVLGRPADRARQALVDPRAPRRARRQGHVGRRLAPRLRLRRRAGRGDRRAEGRRPDRRLDAGQAARARA